MNKRTGVECFLFAGFWLVANAVLGLAPLIFLVITNQVMEKREASPEIEHLLEGGIVLFVCCALMGSVIIDIILSKIKLKKLAFFAVNISPFVLLVIICILYLLTILGHVRHDLFTSFSRFYKFVIIFTVLYCTLGKYLLYKSEN